MKNKLIILIFVFSLIIFVFAFYINSILILEKQEIIATLIIGDNAGFDTNSTALTFGMITTNSVSSRNILIENSYDFPVKFKFNVKGDIKDFLVYEKQVYLQAGENKIISISTIDPADREYGNYSGKVIVITKRDIFDRN